jgi:hypothetical protein
MSLQSSSALETLASMAIGTGIGTASGYVVNVLPMDMVPEVAQPWITPVVNGALGIASHKFIGGSAGKIVGNAFAMACVADVVSNVRNMIGV